VSRKKEFERFLSLESHLGEFAGLGELEKEADIENLPEG